jgi:arsenite methyltransferase
MEKDDIRRLVRSEYGRVARNERQGCGCGSGCCQKGETAESASSRIGYSADDLGDIPRGADLGLGCGNPVAVAALRKGETVLDLGSGAGIDCFLASREVGPAGHVIGVDMTPDMISRARANARTAGTRNVEFRLGEIEDLPVADSSVDAVISNCVINLSPDKPRVFSEAFRVLRPGGRLYLSDIVLTAPLPERVRQSASWYTGCIAGALQKDDYLAAIASAGFIDLRIISEAVFPLTGFISDPGFTETLANDDAGYARHILSIKVSAVKSA